MENPNPTNEIHLNQPPTEALSEYKNNPALLYQIPDDSFFEKVGIDQAELAHVKEKFLQKMNEYAKREMPWLAPNWQIPVNTSAEEIVGPVKERLDRLVPIVLELIKAEEIQYKDALTGAYSADGMRRRFYIEQDRARLAAEQNNENAKVTVLVEFDVDSFKGINDTFGHQAGDEILKAIIKKLTTVLRSTDAIGRRSGDEFSVILSQVEHDEVHAVLEKITTAVREIKNPGNESISITGGAKIIKQDDLVHYVQAREEADTAGVYQKIAEPGTIAFSDRDYSVDLNTSEKRTEWATKVAKRKLKRLIDPYYAEYRKGNLATDKRAIVDQQVALIETELLPALVKVEQLELDRVYGTLLAS